VFTHRFFRYYDDTALPLKLEYVEGETQMYVEGCEELRTIVSDALTTIPIQDVVNGKHEGAPMDPFSLYAIKGVVVHPVKKW
jgi:hypothetical protein